MLKDRWDVEVRLYEKEGEDNWTAKWKYDPSAATEMFVPQVKHNNSQIICGHSLMYNHVGHRKPCRLEQALHQHGLGQIRPQKIRETGHCLKC